MADIVTLPHSAVGWSAVCDCSISWSYSLFLNHGSVCLKSVPLEVLLYRREAAGRSII